MSQTTIKYSTGLLICDAVSDAGFTAEVDFTDHAIDDGSSITDHAVRKPETASLTLTHTQTPMKQIPGFSVAAQPLQVRQVTYGKQTTKLDIRQKKGIPANVSGLISAGLNALAKGAPSELAGQKSQPKSVNQLSVTVLQADSGKDRIGEFFDVLLKLMADVEVLTISFKGRDYSGYVLTSVKKSDQPGRLGASTFNVELKKITTVETKQIKLPAVPRAKAKKDRGVQYGPPPPPETGAKVRASIAAQVADLRREFNL